MSREQPVPSDSSRRRILGATAAALVVAGVVLVTAILPAEYGVDPLGIGRALGLTALSGVADDGVAEAPPAAAAPDEVALAEDVFEVELRPFEGVEYKYRMEAGSQLVYSWTATGEVEYEFHGEPDGAPEGYFDSYDKSAAAAADGGFTAQAAGVHGWFWKNPGTGRITVTLRSAGFYSSSTEYRDGERIVREFPGGVPQ